MKTVNLHEMLRKKAKFVIAYGVCAVYGGIPGLGNLHTVDELTQEAYVNSASTYNEEGIIPSEDVPHLESRVRPLSEAIDVDLSHTWMSHQDLMLLAEALVALLTGEPVMITNNQPL